MMKRFLIFSVFSAFCLVSLHAQDDDMYFSSSRKTKSQKGSVYSAPVQQPVQSRQQSGVREVSIDNLSHSGSMRSVDEYNRRDRFSNSYAQHLQDSLDEKSYAEEEYEDYEHSRKMKRFDGYNNITLIINAPGYDPWYYDPWYYDSWYYDRWAWHTGWHAYYPWYDPWYDPWYYRPGWHFGWTWSHHHWNTHWSHGGWYPYHHWSRPVTYQVYRRGGTGNYTRWVSGRHHGGDYRPGHTTSRYDRVTNTRTYNNGEHRNSSSQRTYGNGTGQQQNGAFGNYQSRNNNGGYTNTPQRNTGSSMGSGSYGGGSFGGSSRGGGFGGGRSSGGGSRGGGRR